MIVKRGYIYFSDLSPVSSSEQGGVRPVVIVQNDISLGACHFPDFVDICRLIEWISGK